jgi:hypothetical protein
MRILLGVYSGQSDAGRRQISIEFAAIRWCGENRAGKTAGPSPPTMIKIIAAVQGDPR